MPAFTYDHVSASPSCIHPQYQHWHHACITYDHVSASSSYMHLHMMMYQRPPHECMYSQYAYIPNMHCHISICWEAIHITNSIQLDKLPFLWDPWFTPPLSCMACHYGNSTPNCLLLYFNIDWLQTYFSITLDFVVVVVYSYFW